MKSPLYATKFELEEKMKKISEIQDLYRTFVNCVLYKKEFKDLEIDGIRKVISRQARDRIERFNEIYKELRQKTLSINDTEKTEVSLNTKEYIIDGKIDPTMNYFDIINGGELEYAEFEEMALDHIKRSETKKQTFEYAIYCGADVGYNGKATCYTEECGKQEWRQEATNNFNTILKSGRDPFEETTVLHAIASKGYNVVHIKAPRYMMVMNYDRSSVDIDNLQSTSYNQYQMLENWSKDETIKGYIQKHLNDTKEGLRVIDIAFLRRDIRLIKLLTEKFDVKIDEKAKSFANISDEERLIKLVELTTLPTPKNETQYSEEELKNIASLYNEIGGVRKMKEQKGIPQTSDFRIQGKIDVYRTLENKNESYFEKSLSIHYADKEVNPNFWASKESEVNSLQNFHKYYTFLVEEEHFFKPFEKFLSEVEGLQNVKKNPNLNANLRNQTNGTDATASLSSLNKTGGYGNRLLELQTAKVMGNSPSTTAGAVESEASVNLQRNSNCKILHKI
jgi:hypothetical protein